jgi:hypothetical protein
MKTTKTRIPLDRLNHHLVRLIFDLQRQFVQGWNEREQDFYAEQNHDLPGGAKYSGCRPSTGARCFSGFSSVLPDGTWIVVQVEDNWDHWYPAFADFRRNKLEFVEQIKSITVHGDYLAFVKWADPLLVKY